MQATKNAMESVKETAANISASAASGFEKTKAVVQEKSERISTRDPVQKEMATQKKEGRIINAEREKQEARDHNAAAKHSAVAQAPNTTTDGQPMAGPWQLGGLKEEVVGSSPTGLASYTATRDGQHLGVNKEKDMPGPWQLGGQEGEVVGSSPSATETGMGGTVL
ncbi:hypothetical protein PIB30_037581 [Stylosanthes scabra]|uniref:Uncharacterized protein n=1 Tax=Stylosanthes scabra TaxID=79078 RepID=A0ABU6VDC2_9FABA|nr:hypothetical protein [Stylosanthes scabra]